MKALPFLILLLLAGCAPDPSGAQTPAVVPVQVVPPPTPLPPRPQLALLGHFDAVSNRELPAILTPGVTAEQIQRIRSADKAARAALRPLMRKEQAPSPEALSRAKMAVHELELALDGVSPHATP